MPKSQLSKYDTQNFTKQKAKPEMKPDEALRIALGFSQSDRAAFEVIKKRLRDLLENHFDWDRLFSEQTSTTWKNINSEIREHMPEIYLTNERHHATRQYMARCFYAGRWRRQKTGQGLPVTEPNQEIPLSDDGSCEANDENIDAAEPIGSQTDTLPENAIIEGSFQADTNVDAPEQKRVRRPRKKRRVAREKEPFMTPDTDPYDYKEEVAQKHLAAASPSPGLGSPPIYTDQPENPICEFLRSCKPSLEHLYPVFVRIGLERKADLEGVLDWGAQERVSWLMELSKEEWGLSRLNVKSLSLAFQVAEQYESMLLAAGVNPRSGL